MALLPQAVREGWGSERLAKEAGISPDTARSILAEMSRKLVASVEAELGLTVSEMRRVATREREAVTKRLSRVGALCDKLLGKAEEVLEAIDCTAEGLQAVQTDKDGEPLPDAEPLPVIALQRCADILAKAGKTAESSWKLFRDASGLDLAERLTEFKARESLKAGKDEGGETWEAEFELLPAGQSPA